MTARPFRVVTPFPSIEKSAKKLGASKAEVVRIEKLVDAVVYGSKKASSGRLVAARKRASHSLRDLPLTSVAFSKSRKAK
jgi:ribosomal protein L25 (general stress protein Ctc)